MCIVAVVSGAVALAISALAIMALYKYVFGGC